MADLHSIETSAAWAAVRVARLAADRGGVLLRRGEDGDYRVYCLNDPPPLSHYAVGRGPDLVSALRAIQVVLPWDRP